VTAITVKVAFRTCRRHEAPAAASKPAAPTAIARRLALAHHVESLIERGELRDLAHAAERIGVTNARMTQVADLALLAPDIQSAVLLGRCQPRDRHLRAVGRHALWEHQRRAFDSLFPNALEGNHDRDRNDD
jgi:hypothetical protein